MKDIMTNHVHDLRQYSTDAENRLWRYLRAKRLLGYKFRRQHLVHPYVVDFVCLEKKLIVELDGGQHTDRKSYDERRTGFLQSKGFKVLRFWNNVVLMETRNVLETILAALEEI